MICSDFAKPSLAGAARRISELLREPSGKSPEHVFQWRHKYHRCRDLVDSTDFDGLGRHAKDHRRRFILGQHKAAGRLDGLCAVCFVIAQSGEYARHAQGASKGRNRFHRDVDIWQVSGDAAASAVKLNSTCLCNAKMLTARTYVQRSRLKRLIGFRFLHADTSEVSELR